MATILEILAGATETTTEATTTEATTANLAEQIKTLTEQIKTLALQTTNPTEYAKLIAEAEAKDRKEKAAAMFNSMSVDEQKKEYASFKKSVTKVTLKDINDEINKQILDIDTAGVKDKDKQNALVSLIMGFDITDNEAIKKERDRRNEEAIKKAAESEVE